MQRVLPQLGKHAGFLRHALAVRHHLQYGGNNALTGRFAQIERNLADARASKTPPDGIALMWESTGYNPVAADFLTDLRWREGRTDLERWIEAYAVRRYGQDTPSLRRAWTLLLDTVYGVTSGDHADTRRNNESIFAARPGSNVKKASNFEATVEVAYDLRQLRDAVSLLLADADGLRDTPTYRYDLVDFTRQYLAGIGLIVYREAMAAERANDAAAFDRAAREFMELIAAQDRLLGSEKLFLLGPWLHDARRAAPPGESDAYERQARDLITLWFPDAKPASLNNYAWREWNGLLKNYYAPRWQAWLNWRNALLNGKSDAAEPDIRAMDIAWTHRTVVSDDYLTRPAGDPVTLARAALARWRHVPDDVSRYKPPTGMAKNLHRGNQPVR